MKRFNFLCQFFSGWLGSKAQATHLSDGRNHTVLVDNLRVLVYEEEPGVWTAQCIDIDYVACGETLKAAKRNFEVGLIGTLKAHLDKFGSLDRFFRRPPSNEWLPKPEKSKNYDVSLMTEHETEIDAAPIHKLTYIEPRIAA